MPDLTELVCPSTSQGVTNITPIASDQFDRWLDAQTRATHAWVKSHDFTAKEGQTLSLPTQDGSIAEIIVGVNSAPESAEAAIWWLAGVPAKIPAGNYSISDVVDSALIASAAIGWALSQYSFNRYKKDATSPNRFLMLPDTIGISSIQYTVAAYQIVRDLINTPAEDMGPPELEAAAKAIAEPFGAKVVVTIGDALQEANLPTIHMVGRAAEKAPRLIDLSWGDDKHPKVTLVGKGVCFDTGGLDIKAAQYMRQMKKDMGGSAHVLGLAHMIMAANLPVRLRVLIPAVENAIAGNAMRPGDVVVTRSGLSVEIGNTDAEGRLVLCDALSLAAEEEPDLLMDFATLTGAARVALGPDLPATFTDDDDLWGLLDKSGQQMNDPLWRMPLWKPYLETMKSDVADTDNISDGGFAGAITAALYLQRFTDGAKSWVHFDVFGWQPKAAPGKPKGGAAQAIRAAFHSIKVFTTADS